MSTRLCQHVSRLLSGLCQTKYSIELELERHVRTLTPAGMFRRELRNVPDVAINDYPAVFWRFVFGDLLD
jgi:hypothetical protein